jgi:hypothetical protein
LDKEWGTNRLRNICLRLADFRARISRLDQMKGEGKMAKYHRIIIDGVPYYREYSYGLDGYGEMLSEDELVQQLLEEVVDEEIEISQREIEAALRRIADRDDRNLLQSYIRYLERISRE